MLFQRFEKNFMIKAPHLDISATDIGYKQKVII